MQKQLTNIASVIKEMSGMSTSIIDSILKQFYAQEVIMSTISVKKFLAVLEEKLKAV
jgi:transposase-like protein